MCKRTLILQKKYYIVPPQLFQIGRGSILLLLLVFQLLMLLLLFLMLLLLLLLLLPTTKPVEIGTFYFCCRDHFIF